MILCNEGKIIIFEHGYCIPALEHVRMLLLNNYVLQVFSNAAFKYGHAWMIFEMHINFQFWDQEPYI